MTQTASFIIIERNQGLFHRSLVAGIITLKLQKVNLWLYTFKIGLGAKIKEMIMAHLVIQSTFLAVQIGLVSILVFLVFKITCKGTFVLALFITLLEGFSSMSYGNCGIEPLKYQF